MNIDEIIERECPRYILANEEYKGIFQQVIRDTHGMDNPVVCTAPLRVNMEHILDEMNDEYEQELRDYFTKKQG